ncbi:MAG TPA: choice-of-anchor V domain-containing protein, partial [Candidatus Acidoferrales bacterium]|nr:choice-of-anchor V domain-containing protein [Candidatus Acidoferrales bacterium]
MARLALQIAPLFVLITVLSSVASAYMTGINGYSGKNRGIICTSCHSGGTAPTVQFDGPSTAAPNAIVTFHFIIQSQSPTQTFAGLDVAASDGTLGIVAGQGEFLLAKEVTHTEPKANDANGAASFEFTWQAPGTPGTYTLFGAGNSVNGDGSERSGDSAAGTTLSIDVGTADPTATPTVPPTPTASPTQVASTCVGDCNGDVEVTVDELIVGVNMALG